MEPPNRPSPSSQVLEIMWTGWQRFTNPTLRSHLQARHGGDAMKREHLALKTIQTYLQRAVLLQHIRRLLMLGRDKCDARLRNARRLGWRRSYRRSRPPTSHCRRPRCPPRGRQPRAVAEALELGTGRGYNARQCASCVGRCAKGLCLPHGRYCRLWLCHCVNLNVIPPPLLRLRLQLRRRQRRGGCHNANA